MCTVFLNGKCTLRKQVKKTGKQNEKIYRYHRFR